jgi:hypothetical protein
MTELNTRLRRYEQEIKVLNTKIQTGALEWKECPLCKKACSGAEHTKKVE